MKDEDKLSSTGKGRKVSLGTYALSLVIVLFIGVFGTIAALYFLNRNPQAELASETAEQNRETASSELTLTDVAELYTVLMSEHFRDLDSSELVEGAMEGMAEAVEDPYTEYLNAVESDSLDQDLQGSFEGIGAEVMKDGDVVRIVSPIPNSPAEEAGLQPNDAILEVDGESVADLNINEAVELIRGPEGTTVELTISRGEDQFTISIARDSIPVESVFYELDEEHSEIGYIQIANFNMPTYDELIEAVEELEDQGATEFIFDVRGNPGGLLTSALEIANIFVEDGNPLMHTKENEEDEPFTYFADSDLYGDVKFEQDAVLLINGGSASASEILAGAMQEAGYPVIGTPSFGKGTVQTIYPLESRGDLKFTNGIWLTAGGEWINEEGLEPDIVVEMPEYQDLLLINPEEVYTVGDQSPEVENINAILRTLGYEVPASDEYTEETADAVRQIQAEENLEQTGEVTGATTSSLISRVQELIQENDTQYEAAVEYIIGKD